MDAPGAIETSERRVYAEPGRTLVLPLVPEGALFDPLRAPSSGWRPVSTPLVRVDDGPALPASVVRLEGRPAPEEGRASAWLPRSKRWTATALPSVTGPTPDDATAVWALAVRMPDEPEGRRLRIGAQRVPIAWLPPPPERTDTAPLPRPDSTVRERAALGDALRDEATDPMRRWRVRLLTDRFAPTTLWRGDPPRGRLDDPILEAYATQRERRVRVALETLRRDDPALAAETLARLTAVVRLPTGALVPAWPLDEERETELVSGLLSPRATPESRRADALAWLAAAPPARAWVTEDAAGASDASGRATIGVTNLSARDVSVGAAPAGRPATARALVPAHESRALVASAIAPDGGPAARLRAAAGDWAAELTVLAAPVVAAPPGVPIGPLYPDWTLATWSGRVAPAPDAAWATRALLQRAEGTEERWQFFVEALTGGAEPRAGDRVSFWIGRAGRAATVIMAESSGGASLATPGETISPVDARVRRLDDRWTALIDLPDGVLSGEGPLLVGVTREDARGRRSAWPRPMAPGQTRPGRLAIELGAWLPDPGDPGMPGVQGVPGVPGGVSARGTPPSPR